MELLARNATVNRYPTDWQVGFMDRIPSTGRTALDLTVSAQLVVPEYRLVCAVELIVGMPS